MSSRPERDRWIRFGPFTLDAANARLRRGDEVIALRGKTLAVLEYLAARPGQLVTKDELLARLWPDVYVSEDVLVGCVRELRRIFGDRRDAPHFIETVYRRGYRWIGKAQAAESRAPLAESAFDDVRTLPIVGRDTDLTGLRRCFAEATRGTRQVVFVAGDAGLGKTALVEEFVRALPSSAFVARGQCVEQYGSDEPFLPILDALERCAIDPLAASSGIMPARAVRLLGGAVETFAADRPFVLVLEDLHWSDPCTLDVLSYLARRRDPCRLMVVATYRPTELILRRHPLRGLEQELRAHGQSVQLPLARLTLGAVEGWLAARGPSPPRALVEWLHGRTEGHPLFLVSLFESLVDAGLVAWDETGWHVQPAYTDLGVPESLRLMIERQAETLDEDDARLLEAASAAGTRFSATSVAAAMEREPAVVEGRCDALARDGRFIRTVGLAEWPDGTVAGAYEFVHELYRSTFYARLPPAQARLLHERIGRRLERGYAIRTDDVATELAFHFERGRDAAGAARYLEQAAAQYTTRGAHREAVVALRRALDLLALLPETAERDDRMLFLNLRLGASLLVAEDYAEAEVRRAFERSRALAEKAGAMPPLLTALAGLHTYHAARGELTVSARIVPRILELAERLPFPQTLLVAHTCAAWSDWNRGALAAACEHAERAIAARPDAPMSFPSTFDLVGYAFGTAALAEMTRGDLARARALSERGLTWSRQTARPVDRATALTLAALLHAFMDEPASAARHAEEAFLVAEEHGFRQWTATARVIATWAAAAAQRNTHSLANVVAQIEHYTDMGLRTQLSAFLCLAAGGHVAAGKRRAAIDLLDRGDAHTHSGEEWYIAELHRVRGEIARARAPRQAETHFQDAIDVARAQGARLWELRAVVGLARLRHDQRQHAAARRALEPVLSSFPDDLDAPDLRAARALRARLA